MNTYKETYIVFFEFRSYSRSFCMFSLCMLDPFFSNNVFLLSAFGQIDTINFVRQINERMSNSSRLNGDAVYKKNIIDCPPITTKPQILLRKPEMKFSTDHQYWDTFL